MDHTWLTNVGNVPPSIPGSFLIGYPQEGNPQLGLQATEPGLWWFHMITEEIRNVIVNAGLVPNPSATNQLFAAIVQLADAAAIGGATSLAQLDPTAAANLTAALSASTTALSQAASAAVTAAAATATANSAVTTANNAAGEAATALGLLGQIASANVLASVQKLAVITDYNTLLGAQTGLDAQATLYGLTALKTTYDNALSSLTTYLTSLTTPSNWNDQTNSTTIVGTIWASTWSAAYNAQSALTAGISNAAQALAATAQSAANTAATNAASALSVANTASTNASNAVTTANAAQTQLAAIAATNTLSQQEKQQVVADYNTIIANQTINDTQAALYGVSTTAYDSAISALTTYLNGSVSGWNVIPGSNITIVGTTFYGNFQAVYTAETTLLNAIASVTATLANWAGVTGTGKPANNATADTTFFTIGTCTVQGNIGLKPTGAPAWDSSIYSKNGFSGGAYAQFSPGQTSCNMMAGLSSNPTASPSYSNIDAAWYMTTSGFMQAYQLGTGVGPSFAYVAGDVLAVDYDGVNIYWLQNGVIKYQVAASGATISFYFMAAMSSTGGFLGNMSLGNTANVTNIGTSQIQLGAVHGLDSTFGGSYTVYSGTGVSSINNTISETGSWTHSQGDLLIDQPVVLTISTNSNALTSFQINATVEVFINGSLVGSFSDYKAVVWGGSTSFVVGMSCAGLVSSAYGFGTVTVKIQVLVTATNTNTAVAAPIITSVNMGAQGYLLEFKV